MALKSVLETLDGVDDAVKSFYTQDEATQAYVLQIDGIDGHPEVASLRNAYNRVKTDKASLAAERDSLQTKMGALPEDFDPEVWERAKGGNVDDAAFAAKLAEVRGSLEGERDDWKGKFESLQADIQRKTIHEQVMQALASSKVPEGPRKAAALSMMEGRKVELSGSDVIIDTDMGPKTLQDFTKQWVSSEGAWAIPAPSGGDAPGSRTGGSSSAPETWGKAKTPAEKVALLKSKKS